MRVIRKAREAGSRIVALGTFDGVHLGHRALLAAAKDYATEYRIPLRVCTFDRHPLEVIRPDQAPPILTTIPEKALQMQEAGVDEMELIRFDRREAETEPEEFLAQLRAAMDLRAVAAGWNYTFGRKGRGTAELLQEDGKKHGYDVLIVPPTTLEDGTAISSSLVRKYLADGDTETVSDLLGYDYTLTGTVREGKHVGRELGFPTANVTPSPRKALPAYGVYTCLAETEDGMSPGIVNVGLQPTLPSGQVTVEVHVLDETPDLYGRKVRLTLLKMLRREMKFASPEELRRQIDLDRREALALFGMA